MTFSDLCGTFAVLFTEQLILPRSFFLCGFGILIFMLFRKNENRSKVSVRPIPRVNLEWWNLFGILKYLPSFTTMRKLGLSTSVYALQIHLGCCELFKKDDVVSFRLGIFNCVFVRKGAALKEFFSNSNIFLDKALAYRFLHPWLGTGLLTSGGPKWKSRRKLLTHSFHLDVLKEFVPIFYKNSKVLVDIMKHRAHEDWLDIVHPIKLCALDIICETIFGVHIGAQTDHSTEYVLAVERLSNTVMKRGRNPLLQVETIFWLSALGRQFKKDLNCVHSFTRKIIQQKKQAKVSELADSQDSFAGRSSSDKCKTRRKALIDVLLDVHFNHLEYTEEDLREEIDTFAFAGHDTTAVAMSWALYLIGLYPEIQSKIHEELDAIYGDDRDTHITEKDLRQMPYLERVLKESQRLYPSVPGFGRNVREDFNLCGYEVKKGSIIGISVYALHRDPDVFPNPEKFNPDRFLPEHCAKRDPFAYVPFSAGPRNCIGQRLAMMEEKTVISNVLRNFHVKSLQQRDEVFPTSELVLRSHCPLKLKFTQRK